MTHEFIDGGLDAHWTAPLAETTGMPRPPIAAAGGGREDIVSVTIYNTRMAEQNIVNAVYSEFFGDHRRTRPHVEVSRLADPGLLIESPRRCTWPGQVEGHVVVQMGTTSPDYSREPDADIRAPGGHDGVPA